MGASDQRGSRWRHLGAARLIEERGQSRWCGHPVGILDEVADVVPVDLTIQPNSQPASVTYVRRTEIAVRRRRQRVSSARLSRTPQMRKLVIVMPIRPQHDELRAYEKAGAPCVVFSITCGNARQSARTRPSTSKLTDGRYCQEHDQTEPCWGVPRVPRVLGGLAMDRPTQMDEIPRMRCSRRQGLRRVPCDQRPAASMEVTGRARHRSAAPRSHRILMRHQFPARPARRSAWLCSATREACR